MPAIRSTQASFPFNPPNNRSPRTPPCPQVLVTQSFTQDLRRSGFDTTDSSHTTSIGHNHDPCRRVTRKRPLVREDAVIWDRTTGWPTNGGIGGTDLPPKAELALPNPLPDGRPDKFIDSNDDGA